MVVTIDGRTLLAQTCPCEGTGFIASVSDSFASSARLGSLHSQQHCQRTGSDMSYALSVDYSQAL